MMLGSAPMSPFAVVGVSPRLPPHSHSTQPRPALGFDTAIAREGPGLNGYDAGNVAEELRVRASQERPRRNRAVCILCKLCECYWRSRTMHVLVRRRCGLFGHKSRPVAWRVEVCSNNASKSEVAWSTFVA